MIDLNPVLMLFCKALYVPGTSPIGGKKINCRNPQFCAAEPRDRYSTQLYFCANTSTRCNGLAAKAVVTVEPHVMKVRCDCRVFSININDKKKPFHDVTVLAYGYRTCSKLYVRFD